MRMQDTVGLQFPESPWCALVCTSKPPKALSPSDNQPASTQRLLCKNHLSLFAVTVQPPTPSYCVSSLPPGGLLVHSLVKWMGSLSLGTDMWLGTNFIVLPSWDPIFYIRGVPTWEQLRSCLPQWWLLHGPARAHVSIAMVLTGILLVLAAWLSDLLTCCSFKPGQPPKLFKRWPFWNE